MNELFAAISCPKLAIKESGLGIWHDILNLYAAFVGVKAKNYS
ncbi:MAG: hypothetical protein ACUVRU_04720 [Anaerolineae bacterium]